MFIRRLITVMLTIAAIVVAVILVDAIGKHHNTTTNSNGNVTVILQLPDTNTLAAKLDGATFGLSGLTSTYKLSVGQHHLAITKTGYQPFSTTFSVVNGQSVSINVTMQRVSTPTPTATVAQIQAALATSLSNYTIQKTVYFYDDTWAFVQVMDAYGDGGIVVTSYNAATNSWSIALGPGTGFGNSNLVGLPNDVITYMKNNNYVAGS